MILNDKQILDAGIVVNGVSTKVQKGGDITSSYGIDPQGYTFTLEAEEDVLIKSFECLQLDSQESFQLPSNVCAFMYGKSSYTRRGLIFSFAVVDAGYEGKIGFSVFNASEEPITLKAKQGIAQIVFHEIAEPQKIYEGAWQGYGLEYEVLGDK